MQGPIAILSRPPKEAVKGCNVASEAQRSIENARSAAKDIPTIEKEALKNPLQYTLAVLFSANT